MLQCSESAVAKVQCSWKEVLEKAHTVCLLPTACGLGDAARAKGEALPLAILSRAIG